MIKDRKLGFCPDVSLVQSAKHARDGAWIVAVWPEGRSARSKFETAIYLKIGFGCWVAEWVALLAGR